MIVSSCVAPNRISFSAPAQMMMASRTVSRKTWYTSCNSAKAVQCLLCEAAQCMQYEGNQCIQYEGIPCLQYDSNAVHEGWANSTAVDIASDSTLRHRVAFSRRWKLHKWYTISAPAASNCAVSDI